MSVKEEIFSKKNLKYITMLDRIKLLFTKMEHTFDYDNDGYYSCVDYKVKNGKIYVFNEYQVRAKGSFTINDGKMEGFNR